MSLSPLSRSASTSRPPSIATDSLGYALRKNADRSSAYRIRIQTANGLQCYQLNLFAFNRTPVILKQLSSEHLIRFSGRPQFRARSAKGNDGLAFRFALTRNRT